MKAAVGAKVNDIAAKNDLKDVEKLQKIRDCLKEVQDPKYEDHEIIVKVLKIACHYSHSLFSDQAANTVYRIHLRTIY
jgi:hypothetical protein